ncbi:hypothetical protein SAMN05445504_8069 [Burkholderia sp. CF099]|nr:hypothetical protein SAMN05445504_8069 [Burkholderia sp. CF099]
MPAKEPCDTHFYSVRSSLSDLSPASHDEAANANMPMSMFVSELASDILLTSLCAVTHSTAYKQNETLDAFLKAANVRHTKSFI